MSSPQRRFPSIYTNAVYYPNQRVLCGDTPSKLNYECINRVYYAYATVSMNGGVFLSDEKVDALTDCDGAKGALGSLLKFQQRYSYLEVVLSIGGSESAEAFPIVASSPVLRDNFARSVRGLLDASGLNGIDIVWDYPCTPEQGRDFLALVATVRIYLPEGRNIVTATLPAVHTVLRNIDLGQAAKYLDNINLAAYDFFGPWSPRTGHQAQLYAMNKDEPSGAAAVRDLLSAGVPSRKILLGIPLFGRSFLHASGPGHKNRGYGGGLDGSFEYSQLPRMGTKEQVDKRAVAAQCVGGDGGFVSYDNPETVKMKAAFCKQKRLGGLFYWSGPSDSKDPKRTLIATGFKALHSS
ncbi:hypothetical protein VTH82DRAFT_3678 [Thermothelomyces myriococcoides]